jgi:peroxiredoxin
MESLVRHGQIAPSFTLPSGKGTPIRRTAYRAKRNLVLIVVPHSSDASMREYMQAMAEGYTSLQSERAEVLVILGDTEAAASALQAELPFPVLADVDGRVIRQFLPEDARGGVFVTDRYGELYLARAVAEAGELPSVDDVYDWLVAIERQCSI